MNEVTAYCPNKQIPELRSEDIKRFDRINLAFVVLDEGDLSFKNLENIKYVNKIRAINKDIKLIISVGGAGAAGFSTMAQTKEGREKFAQQCLTAIEKYKLDGMDLDWEFPGSVYEGMDYSANDKENYTLLLKELRETFDKNSSKHLELSIAAGCGQWFLEQTDVKAYAPYLDNIYLMTYDLRGFGQDRTGHHTCLYLNEQEDPIYSSANSAVQDFLSLGVPSEKLHIGAAFYSRYWTGVENKNQGLFQKADPSGDFGPNYDELRDKYINKQGFKRYFDTEAKAPYLFNGETFVSYDDAESVAYKAKYCQEHDLGGIFFWRYINDEDNELIKTMDEIMH